MPTTLRVVQLNCNGQLEAGPQTARFMVENTIHMALLQEHHASPVGLPTGFGQHMRVFCNAGGERGANKAAIVINAPDVEVVPLDHLMNEWGTCVWTKGGYGELVICSMYCKWRVPLEPYMQYLDAVIDAAQGRPLLVGMDANARSRMWHSKVRLGTRGLATYGGRGLVLEALVLRRGLQVVNEPSDLFTFCGARGQSDIDVSLANEGLVARFRTEWRVAPEVCGSDHNALIITLVTEEEFAPPAPVTVRWSTKGVDWVRFQAMVREFVSELPADGTALEQQLAYDAALTRVCEACLTKESAKRARLQLWWTAELNTMRQQARRARERYQRARKRSFNGPALTEEVVQTKQAYRRVQRVYGRRMLELKAADWKRFVAEESGINPWGAVYRLCRGRASTTIGCLRKDGGMTSTWEESAHVLLTKFLPSQDLAVEVVPVAAVVALAQPQVVCPITEAELRLALAKFHSKRAPGLDGRRADVVRKAFLASPDVAVRMFNSCLAAGYFPEPWKEGQLVTFLKSPEKDARDPSSYRPITLLSVLGKLLERVMVSRLVGAYNGGSPRQFGFTSGRSTAHAWLRVKADVAECPDKYVVGLFVDFRGAFDNLSWSAILAKLERIGCAEMAMWRSYFANRRSCLVGRQSTVWRDAERGCPQGSISGPFIWNMMMDDLLSELHAGGIRHVAYADDLLMVVGARSRQALECAATAALLKAVQWGIRAGVEVSFAKTEALMMRGSFHAERMPVIRVGDERVAIRDRVRYLGVHVGAGLTFVPHLKATHEKLLGVIAPLKRVLRRQWGLRKRATKAWIVGLMRAVAMYGAPVWYEASQTSHGRRLLLKQQHLVLVSTLRVCRTVSTVAMQVLAGCLPYDIEAQRQAGRFKCKHNLPMCLRDLVTDGEAAASGCLKLIDERARSQWQRRWTNSSQGRTTYAYMSTVGDVPDRFDPSLRCLFLLTGHGSMNAYLHKHTLLQESPRCRCGAAVEDWRHVLTDCRQYDDIRNVVRMGVAPGREQLDVRSVLRCQETYEEFSKFAEAAFQRRAQQIEEWANADANE